MAKFFGLFVFFFCFLGINSSFSAARMAACTLGSISSQASSQAMDGSNCDVGLVCDRSLLLCSLPNETLCNAQRGGCSLGTKCVSDAGIIIPYNPASAAGAAIGTCQVVAGSQNADDNALSDAMCNIYKIATGKIGRGLVVCVLFVTGISFYLGKVSWGTLISVAIGAGFCFGGPAIVGVLVGGKSFVC